MSILLLEGNSSTFLSGSNELKVTVKSRQKGKVCVLVEGQNLNGQPLFAPVKRTLRPGDVLTAPVDSFVVEVRARASAED